MFEPLTKHEVGVVVALASEAIGFAAGYPGVNRLVGDDHLRVSVAGIGRERAAAASRSLVEQGVRLLVSWGIAAGLAPELKAGDVVFPRSVMADGQEWVTDAAWRERFERALAPSGPAVTGRLWCSQAPIAFVAEKNALAKQGFVAADMESAAVAAVADSVGLPFVALKVVCDPVHREVPGAALGMIDASGHVTLRGLPDVVRAGPRVWRQMLALRLDFTAARHTLTQAALVLSK